MAPSVREKGGVSSGRGKGIRSGRSFTGGRSSGKGSGRGRGASKKEPVLSDEIAPPAVHVNKIETATKEESEKPNIYIDIDPEDQALMDLLNSDDEDEDEDEDDDEIEDIKLNRGTEDSYHLRDSNYFDEVESDQSEDDFDTESSHIEGTYDQGYDFDEDEEHRKLLEALEGAIDSEEEEGERSSEEVEDPSFIDGDDDLDIVSPFKETESKPRTPPPPLMSPVDKRRDRVRLRVLEEILATERTYYSRLCILVDSFLEPLVKFVETHKDRKEGHAIPPRTTSNHSDSDRHSQKGGGGSVPPRTTSNRSDTEMTASIDNGNFFSLPDPTTELFLIEECFGNVRELKDFTKLFLDDLEQGYIEQNIGPVFFKHCDDVEFSDLYYNYMKMYKEGRAKLERLQGKYWFTVFVAAVQLQPQTKNLLLRDFLIEPVQRVPRYKLLLGELIKHTEAGAVLDQLKEAHAQVGKVALAINGKLNKFEQANKIHHLSVSWGFDLKKTGREFIREGVLTKTDRRSRPAAYHFVLFNDLLIFGNSTGRRGSFKAGHQNSSDKFKLKFRVPLCDCLVIDGTCVINSEQTRPLSDLAPLSTLAEVKRRKSAAGDKGSLARAAAAQVNVDDVGSDDLEMLAAVRAAELVANAARQEESCKRGEVEAKSWRSIIESGLTMERLLGVASEEVFVIASPIKALVLSAPNRQQHNAWVESFSNALQKLQASSTSLGFNAAASQSAVSGEKFVAAPPLGDDRPPSPRARRRSIGGLFGATVSSHHTGDTDGDHKKEGASRPPMGRRRSFFGGKLGAVARDLRDASKDKQESPKVIGPIEL